jgi:hypothetical protein
MQYNTNSHPLIGWLSANVAHTALNLNYFMDELKKIAYMTVI